MQLRFLADANLDQDIVAGLLRREPSIDFELPQSVLADGTGDPTVLGIAASLGRVLVTHDVRTMPFHFSEFILHSFNVARPDFGSAEYADQISNRRTAIDLACVG